MIKVYGRDIIALAIITALFYLKYNGANGVVDTAIALIVGYYFSKRVYEETNNKGGKTNENTNRSKNKRN